MINIYDEILIKVYPHGIKYNCQVIKSFYQCQILGFIQQSFYSNINQGLKSKTSIITLIKTLKSGLIRAII